MRPTSYISDRRDMSNARVAARHEPGRDGQAVPRVDGRDREREIAQLLFGELGAHLLVDRVRNTVAFDPGYGLRPGQRRLLAQGKERRLSPRLERVDPVMRLAHLPKLL